MAFRVIGATRVFGAPTRRGTLCQRCGIEIEPRTGRPGIHCMDCHQVLKPMSARLERRLAKLNDGWQDLVA